MGRKDEAKTKPVKAVKIDRPTRRPKRPGTVKKRSGYGKAADFHLAAIRRAGGLP